MHGSVGAKHDYQPGTAGFAGAGNFHPAGNILVLRALGRVVLPRAQVI